MKNLGNIVNDNDIVTKKYVDEHLEEVVRNQDLKKYIL